MARDTRVILTPNLATRIAEAAQRHGAARIAIEGREDRITVLYHQPDDVNWRLLTLAPDTNEEADEARHEAANRRFKALQEAARSKRP